MATYTDFLTPSLKTTAGSEHVRFLRAFYFTKSGHVSKSALVDEYKTLIKENSSNAKELIQFVSSISSACSNWKNLTEANVPKNSHLSSMLAGFRSLGMSQHLPLFLAALNRKATGTTIGNLVKIVDFLAIRVFATTGVTANNFEKEFATWSKSLATGSNQSSVLEKIKKEIKKKKKLYNLSDEAFRERFSTAQFNQSQRRYVLQGLERFISKDGAEKYFADNDELHIEHILPKASNTKCWRDAIKDEAIREHYLNNLGNLTLLYKTENIGIKNKCYPDKLKVYKKSKMRITRALSKPKYKTWNEKAIQARLIELADKAVQVWRM